MLVLDAQEAAKNDGDLLELPTNSSIRFGRVPAAGTTAGLSINLGIDVNLEIPRV